MLQVFFCGKRRYIVLIVYSVFLRREKVTRPERVFLTHFVQPVLHWCSRLSTQECTHSILSMEV
jgi:hypothetical protein